MTNLHTKKNRERNGGIALILSARSRSYVNLPVLSNIIINNHDKYAEHMCLYHTYSRSPLPNFLTSCGLNCLDPSWKRDNGLRRFSWFNSILFIYISVHISFLLFFSRKLVFSQLSHYIYLIFCFLLPHKIYYYFASSLSFFITVILLFYPALFSYALILLLIFSTILVISIYFSVLF